MAGPIDHQCDHVPADHVCAVCTIERLHGRLNIPASEPALTSREAELVASVMASGRLTQGPMVERFEAELAARLGVKHAIATCNGTAAVHLALVAAVEGVGLLDPDAEVLVPDLSFVATANAVAYTGARPVLVDIDPRTWGMDPDDVARKLSSRTVAMIPVHLYGKACDLRPLLELAEEHGVVVVEDAAEALGGSYGGRSLGTWGEAGAFSFYGNKLITTGEGGAVVTDSDHIARAARLFRGQGQKAPGRYVHHVTGFNYRMTELQAAVGVGQLERLGLLLDARAAVFEVYARIFGRAGWSHCGAQAAPWQFCVRVPAGVDRAELMARLASYGIDTRPMFTPMHDLPMFERPAAQFPHATALGADGLALPTFPALGHYHAELIALATTQIAAALAAGRPAAQPVQQEG